MSQPYVLSYPEARRRVKAKAAPANWRTIAADFSGEVWPDFNPSFEIRAGDVVFTMGSCFARNIESHLAMLGCRVPMMDFDLPPSEWSGGAHGAMNRFHPPAFRQTLEWTARIFDRDGKVTWEDCEPLAFDFGGGRYFDLDMGATAPVARERFLERRQHVYDIFSQVFSASCLMMTPGLIEAWRDRMTGLYIHQAPKLKPLMAEDDRWEFEVLPYETCHRDMLAAIDVVRARNPGLKVLLTTSPVPLTSTFTGQDVRIANTYSKSVLRAVCGAATFERTAVDYFPSYESVTLSWPKGVWKDDRLHVSHPFIAKIVTRMLDRYLSGVDEADRSAQRARMHLLGGQVDVAERDAREALAARPDHFEARILLADALTRSRRPSDAVAELELLAGPHAERPALWLAFARARMRLGGDSRVQAIADVERALALEGVSLIDLRSIAEQVCAAAEPEAAERIARRMSELFPLHVESYQALVNVLIAQNRREEAIEVLRKTMGLRRTPLAMYVQLGSLLGRRGDVEEAEGYLRTALQIDPENPKAKSLLERFAKARPAPAAADAA